MGDLNIHHRSQDQSDIAERVLAQIEHAQGHENHMNRIAHPLEVCFSKQLGHGWGRDSSRLWYEHRMPALLVAAGVMVIMFATMVQIHGFAADWAGWVIWVPLFG